MLVAGYLIVGLSVCVIPFALARAFKRRWPSSYYVFFIGAMTFAASQVVHVPLNALLGFSLNDSLARLPSPLLGVTVALIAGLSAGLCEEWARYLAFRFVLPTQRSYPDSLMHGLGHGGIEAVFGGLLVLASVLVMWAMLRAGPDAFAATPEDRAVVRESVEGFYATHWLMPWVGGLERGFVVPFHIANSVLVAYGVRSRRLRWVWLAVLSHTVLDALTAYLAPRGALFAEVGIGAASLATVGLVVALGRLREPEEAVA